MASAKGVKVVILAGGFGSRLGELTRDVPKPMIDVNGRPFLEYIVGSFVERDFREFVFLTGYRGEQIERHFGDGSALNISIAYSREEEPLGTGGAIRQARALISDRFLLTYADVFRRFDYDRFVTEHERACLAVYAGSGNTEIAKGKVTRFDKRAQLPYVDAGFCVMPATVIDFLPERGSFEEIVFPRLAADRELACEVVGRDFVEIGTPEALANARATLG